MPLTKDEVLKRIESGESFEDVEIGDVDFSGHVFKEAVDFSGARFVGKADFSKATFSGEASFSGARFSDKASFGGAKFSYKAYFIGAAFSDKADFIWAAFSGVADFSWAAFSGVADFSVATFSGMADFIGATFSGKAYFFRAAFSGEAYFRGATFSGEADFSGARFSDRVIFAGMDKSRVFSESHPALFRNVTFEKPARVLFKSVRLNRCSFIDTDVSKADFTDVEWPTKKGFLTDRKAIYDEASEDKDKNYELVEKVYRQLKKNYEERGSYGEAGDFHYGEMEMRRLAHRPVFRYISLTFLYKALSGYGEKHWRALFWLFMFVLAFSGGYLLLGMKAAGGGEVVRLCLKASCGHFSWNDFAGAFVNSLEVATFQRHRAFTPLTLGGRALEAIERIVIPIQAALSVLAIRRRFRR